MNDDSWENYVKGDYKTDLMFSVGTLIIQYLLLLIMFLFDLSNGFIIGGSSGFGLSCVITSWSCRKSYKKYRDYQLNEHPWYSLKEFGGWK